MLEGAQVVVHDRKEHIVGAPKGPIVAAVSGREGRGPGAADIYVARIPIEDVEGHSGSEEARMVELRECAVDDGYKDGIAGRRGAIVCIVSDREIA